MQRQRRPATDERGFATVEFIVAFPLVLLLVWIGFQLVFVFFANRVALAGAIKTRLAREAERSQSQGTYDANVLWLQGLQGALDDANAALRISAGQLGALQSCVAGATEALNQAAAGDTGGLAVTVRGIQGVCSEAGVQL